MTHVLSVGLLLLFIVLFISSLFIFDIVVVHTSINNSVNIDLNNHLDNIKFRAPIAFEYNFPKLPLPSS